MGEDSPAGLPEEVAGGFGRREALRKAGRLGALVWTVPVVRSFDIPAVVGSPKPPGDTPPPVDLPPPGGTTPPGGAPPPSGSPPPVTPVTLAIQSLSTQPRPFHVRTDRALQIECFVTAAATVDVKVVRNGRIIRRLSGTALEEAGWARFRWNAHDGKRKASRGRYSIVVKATGPEGSAEAHVGVRLKG